MKFLCTKVRPTWLELPTNRSKVIDNGLKIKDPFIGIEVSDKPTEEEKATISKAIEALFSKNKHAFPIRIVEL